MREASMTINESMRIPKRNLNESMMGQRGRIMQTEYTANKLVKLFDAPQSRDFFLKCAWHLSEATIWDFADAARRPAIKNPTKYFVKCCAKALRAT